MKITRPKLFTRTQLSLAILLLLLASPLRAQTIITKTLDNIGFAGEFTSQAVINGNPAISYKGSGLKYVRALDPSGTNWDTPVTADSSAGSAGEYTSLATVNGNPAISYFANGISDLKYVRALDASGMNWATPVTVESAGNVGGFTSLAVVNGKPAISYYDWANSALKYVRALDANGTNWDVPVTLDNTASVGGGTSLVVINGNPAISYTNFTNGHLKYVRALDASGTNWDAPVTVDSTGTVDYNGTSMAVINGNPAVSYYDYVNADLKYVRALDVNGTTWDAPMTPASAGMVGGMASLAMINGNPAVSYYDQTIHGLKYVRALDASGTTWDAPMTVDDPTNGDVGAYTSLSVVNGNAAISYLDLTNRDLKWAIILTTNPTPTPGSSAQVGNISTRLAVETGDNALIGGFIIAGAQPKRVIIRAMGPSLPLSGVLADPILEFHGSDGTAITNDNWRSSQESEIIATGIQPGNDLEAAIIATLPPGGHTAIVRGTNNTTGVGLVEVYDLDSAADSRMANVSTRGLVQAGDNALIGGTIVTGSGSVNALIRAIGPSLSDLGVPNALGDPTLELRDGSGTLVASNDQWQETQQAEIQATGLAPTNNLESAILRSLSPGGYTAIVRGKNDTTGVGLVEIYALQ